MTTTVRRLSSLGSKSLAHRKGRSALTAGGIVLGVAILFGVLVANATTQRGVDDLIEDFTGRADVIVGASGSFDATVPQPLEAELAELPDVDAAVGGFGFSSTLRAGEERVGGGDNQGFGGGGIAIRGVVVERARLINNFEFLSGEPFTPGTNGAIVPNRLAEAARISVGDTVEVFTLQGPTELEIVGILDDGGAARANEGNSVFIDLALAQHLDAHEGELGGVSLILAEGTDADAWIERHEATYPSLSFENTDTLAEGFKNFLQTFGAVLTFFAAITLFVGTFLIYLTLSMAVIERTRVYGTLRALGATRRQVRRLVIREALVLGFLSSIVGLLVGLGIAKVLLGLFSSVLDLELPGLTVTPSAVIAAMIVGLLTTLASALLPARRAGRLAPVVAMKGDYAGELRLSRVWIAGLVLVIVSLGVLFGASNLPQAVGSLAQIALLLGAVLLVPLLLRPVAAILGRVTRRIAHGVGDIAVLHLVKERSRSAYTLALIMVVMGMLFATGGMFLSISNSVDELIDRQFGSDLFVGSNSPLDDGVADDLRGVEGVAAVSPVAFGTTRILTGAETDQGDEVFVRVIDPESYFDMSSFLWDDGDDTSAKAALAEGGAVLLPGPLADDLGLERGDDIVLKTQSGETTFTLAALFVSTPGPPSIAMGFGDAREHLGTERPRAFFVNLVDGAEPAAVREAIEADLGEQRALFVETPAEEKAEAKQEIGQFFNIINAILLVAAIVGLLGLANTLAMSVLRRFREIGILRSLGVTRGQIWRMVLAESATMGLAAFVLALPLGWVLTYLVVKETSASFGFRMDTIYPYVWIPAVFAFGLFVAVVASIAPGRRAAKLEVVSALQYE